MTFSIRLRRLAYRFAFWPILVWNTVHRRDVEGVKCVIVDDERVLLVRHTYGFRAWDLPGGRVSRGEAPARAAAREAGEELGLHGLDWRDLGAARIPVRRGTRAVACFAVSVSDPPLTIDRGEIEQAQWFWREHLPVNRSSFIEPALALLAGSARPPAA